MKKQFVQNTGSPGNIITGNTMVNYEATDNMVTLGLGTNITAGFTGNLTITATEVALA